MNDLMLLMALFRRPAYGYALRKTAASIFGGGAMHNNVIYPSLKRFVENGWVEQATVPGDRGQQRKQYRITALGKKYFLQQLGEFGAQEAADEGAFLLRIAFLEALPKKKRGAIIDARKSFLTARAEELSKLGGRAEQPSLGMAVLDRVVSRLYDELRWIRDIESQFIKASE